MPKTPFLLIFLAAVADSASLPEFTGYWESTNPRDEIAALRISLEGSRLTVRAAARCGTLICDWGSAENRCVHSVSDNGYLVREQSLYLDYKLFPQCLRASPKVDGSEIL